MRKEMEEDESKAHLVAAKGLIQRICRLLKKLVVQSTLYLLSERTQKVETALHQLLSTLVPCWARPLSKNWLSSHRRYKSSRYHQTPSHKIQSPLWYWLDGTSHTSDSWYRVMMWGRWCVLLCPGRMGSALVGPILGKPHP